MRTCILFLSAALLPAATDPADVIRRSVSRDQSNWERIKDFTFEERVETRQLDKSGRVKDTESRTFDVIILEGSPYQRLIRKDDQKLSPEEDAKQQKKLDEELRKRRDENDGARERRIRDFEKRRAENRAFAREIPEAFDFRLAGEETVDGRRVWVIDAEPRSGYEPKAKRADILKKVRGRIWIDQGDYQWVKMDTEVIDTLSFGLFLFRIQKGTRLAFEQRQERGIWVPSLVHLGGSAKLGMVKSFHLEQDWRYSNYRQFSTDAKMMTLSETQ